MRALVSSGSDAKVRGSKVQSAFQFVPKVFSGVEVRDRTLMFLQSNLSKPCLHRARFVNRPLSCWSKFETLCERKLKCYSIRRRPKQLCASNSLCEEDISVSGWDVKKKCSHYHQESTFCGCEPREWNWPCTQHAVMAYTLICQSQH